jgi:hypothetical protein
MRSQPELFDDDVRSMLAAVDPPVTHLQVDGVLASGRRRARVRRHARVGATAAAVAVLAAVPFALGALRGQPADPFRPAAGAGGISDAAASARIASCRSSALPMPAGVTSAGITGADPTGRYVVGSSNDRAAAGETSLHAIVWDNARPQVIPVTGDSVTAVAVNSAGVVAGQGDRADAAHTGFAWIFRDGAVTELAPPPGYASAVAEAINANDDVVGVATKAGGAVSVAVLWPGGGPAARVLAAPESAFAAGIADDGTVVGMLAGKHGAYVWNANGAGHLLPDPDGLAGGGALAIRGDWVVGFANVGANASAPAQGATPPRTVSGGDGSAGGTLLVNAVRWNLRTGAVTRFVNLGSLGGVNARGDAVVSQAPGTARIVVGDKVVTLPPATSGGTDLLVALSDDASVAVGYESTAAQGSANTPVIWHC